jgi:hypothetical protein
MCNVKLGARLLLKYISYVRTIGQIVFEETSVYQYAFDLTENNRCIRFSAHIMTSLY